MYILDTIFTITEKMKSADLIKKQIQEDQSNNNNNNQDDNQPIALVRRDSQESAYSEDIWTGKSRITTLKAADPEVCIYIFFPFY